MLVMIPPHLKRVAAPPCEMLSGFEYEYLQGSVATHLRCVVILIKSLLQFLYYYHLISFGSVMYRVTQLIGQLCTNLRYRKPALSAHFVFSPIIPNTAISSFIFIRSSHQLVICRCADRRTPSSLVRNSTTRTPAADMLYNTINGQAHNNSTT